MSYMKYSLAIPSLNNLRHCPIVNAISQTSQRHDIAKLSLQHMLLVIKERISDGLMPNASLSRTRANKIKHKYRKIVDLYLGTFIALERLKKELPLFVFQNLHRINAAKFIFRKRFVEADLEPISVRLRILINRKPF